MIKEISILCLLAFYCNTAIYSQKPIKNKYSIGIDGLFGQFNSNRKLGGILFHGGYDIFFPQIPFLSIEPKVGVGYFGGSQTKTIDSTPISDYSITCLTAGVSPKLYLSLNPDDNAFIFLENEFSLLNGYAKIKDKNSNNTRHTNKPFLFYYTLKLGLVFNFSEKNKFAVWVGGSTLNFDSVLNKNIPTGRNNYSGETPSYAAGINFYL